MDLVSNRNNYTHIDCTDLLQSNEASYKTLIKWYATICKQTYTRTQCGLNRDIFSLNCWLLCANAKKRFCIYVNIFFVQHYKIFTIAWITNTDNQWLRSQQQFQYWNPAFKNVEKKLNQIKIKWLNKARVHRVKISKVLPIAQILHKTLKSFSLCLLLSQIFTNLTIKFAWTFCGSISTSM